MTALSGAFEPRAVILSGAKDLMCCWLLALGFWPKANSQRPSTPLEKGLA